MVLMANPIFLGFSAMVLQVLAWLPPLITTSLANLLYHLSVGLILLAVRPLGELLAKVWGENHLQSFDTFFGGAGQRSPHTQQQLNSWLANFKSLVSAALLIKLAMLMSHSRALMEFMALMSELDIIVGLNSHWVMIVVLSAHWLTNILWVYRDWKQMRVNEGGKEMKLFFVDTLAKLGIIFTAFRMASTASMGVLPAFTAMQLLYALPKIKASYVYPNMCSQGGKGPGPAR